MADVFFTGDDEVKNYGLTLQSECFGEGGSFGSQIVGANEMQTDPGGCFFNPCFLNPITSIDFSSFLFQIADVESFPIWIIEKRVGGAWVFTSSPLSWFSTRFDPDITRPTNKSLAGVVIDWGEVYNDEGEGIYRLALFNPFNQTLNLYSQPFDLVQYECGGRNVDGTVVLEWKNKGIYPNFNHTRENRQIQNFDLSNLSDIPEIADGWPDMRRYWAKAIPESPSTEQNFTEFADGTNELNFTNEFLNWNLLIREITYEGLMRLKFYGLRGYNITFTDYNTDSPGAFEKVDVIDSGEDISFQQFPKNRNLYTSQIAIRSEKGLNFKLC
ncbi:MAG: hypothetical protein ACXABD_16060 [Candidatus Thorarchaeota archaeon]|jgi:hypothetical protein